MIQNPACSLVGFAKAAATFQLEGVWTTLATQGYRGFIMSCQTLLVKQGYPPTAEPARSRDCEQLLALATYNVPSTIPGLNPSCEQAKTAVHGQWWLLPSTINDKKRAMRMQGTPGFPDLALHPLRRVYGGEAFASHLALHLADDCV